MEHLEAAKTTQANSAVNQHPPADQAEADMPPPPELDLNDVEELVMLSFNPSSPETKDKLYQLLHKYHVDAPELKYLF